jgi:hypothetical protein
MAGGAMSPDRCDSCGHANLNRYCECCNDNHKEGK